MPRVSDSALRAALAELVAIGTDKDREQLAAITERLDAARLRVLVAGEAKRGKSSLVNALLGRSVLPTGVTPLTAVATTVRQGDDPRVSVRYADGHQDRPSAHFTKRSTTSGAWAARSPRGSTLISTVTRAVRPPEISSAWAGSS
ncbi:MAG TPA: dynamin family protein [Trebonia sp.]|jgi:GTPase SAR1 family protein